MHDRQSDPKMMGRSEADEGKPADSFVLETRHTAPSCCFSLETNTEPSIDTVPLDTAAEATLIGKAEASASADWQFYS